MRSAPAFCLLMLAPAWGCEDRCSSAPVEGGEGAHVRYEDPEETLSDFLAHPFPSDALRTGPGPGVKLSHFPNPSGSSTLQDYLGVMSARSFGFASTTAIYIGLSEDIDPASLPQDPQASMAPDASVYLVDIDPNSNERGRRYPLEFRYSEQPSFYLPAHHLIARPLYGATLLSGHRYALVITDQVRTSAGAPLSAHPNFRRALGGCTDSVSERLLASMSSLADYLQDEAGAEPGEGIAGAAVFTTQDNLATLSVVTEAAKALPPPEVVSAQLLEADLETLKLRADIEMPSFQAGNVPYDTIEDGGFIALDEDGRPSVTHTERTRVGLSIPRGRPMPENGWPVVLYAHGTGGSYQAAFSNDIAPKLARQGIAMVSYDQTLHGPRDPTGSDPNLTFFNLGNPIAARDNIRQASADLTFMTKLLETISIDANVFGSDRDLSFDADRMVFFGHSQGSVTGAPWVMSDERMKAVVFSGLGAIFAVTIMDRKDIVNFEALLSTLLGFPPEEQLDEFHPLLYLMQMFIEPADPIGYARAFLRDMPVNRDVLMVEGLLDPASPARGQEAFATAAGLPVVGDVARLPLSAQLLGPEPVPAPATKNVSGPKGEITYGLIQYPESGHFPVFNDSGANRRFVEFIRSALFDERATIIP